MAASVESEALATETAAREKDCEPSPSAVEALVELERGAIELLETDKALEPEVIGVKVT